MSNTQSVNRTGTNEANFLSGGSVNDTLTGLGGNDTLWGLSGSDIIYGGNGVDRIIGGSGRDTLYGNNGNDVMAGGELSDVLYGGDGQDVLEGDILTPEEDAVYREGNDRIYGGAGADSITGNAGKDSLYGDSGNDTILGGDGNDRIYGRSGTDELNGDAGRDTFFQVKNNGADTIDGGDGTDTVDYRGLTVEQLIANVDNGNVDYNDETENFSNIERLIGTSNTNDTVTAEGDSTGVIINLLLKSVSGTATGVSSITGFEFVTGGSGNDVLTGNSRANQLSGEDGNDTLSGGEGNDSLSGGEGNDTYTGFASGFDTDAIEDEDGTDILVLTSFSLDDIASFDTNDITDEVEGVEDLIIRFNGGDQITIADYFDGSSENVDEVAAGSGSIESIQLSDSVTLDFEDIVDLLDA